MKKFSCLVLVSILSLSLVACSVDQVLADVDLALQMTASLEVAVGNLSPADGAILAKLVGIASNGLVAVQAAYKTYEASGAQSDLDKAQEAARIVQMNLGQFLAAAHISNDAAVKKVTAWVNLVTIALDAVLQLSKQIRAAVPQTPGQFAAVDKAAAPLIPTATELHKRWQKEVCAGDKKCGKLVAPRKIKRQKAAGTGFLNSLGNAIGESIFGGNR